MDLSDLQRTRAEAIDSMNASLGEIQRVDAPPWVLSTLMVPIFIGLVVWESLLMAWMLARILTSLAVKALVAPFAVLWLFVDICRTAYWYLSLVVQKMTGGRK